MEQTSAKSTAQTGSNTFSAKLALLSLRLILGGAFLEAGLDKLINGFSAVGYLQHGTGPFAGFFAGMASSAGVINGLVIWGEILIGIAVISGGALRFASLAGVIMMVLYYLPYLPPSNGWIGEQIVYAFIFIALMFSGSGYFFGVDAFFVRFETERHPLRILLG